MNQLARPEGHITYTDTGSGPLIIAVPGMGDVRASYENLAPSLVDAGYRVVVTDLRGHGDADTTFTSYGDEATAGDLIALLEHLDAGPAVLIGSSMGASAALIAAADRPDLVRGVVSLAGFLRDPMAKALAPVMRTLYRVLFARPWGGTVWPWYVKSALGKGRPTPGLDERIRLLRATYRDPARVRALRRLAVALDHSQVERRLSAIQTPVLAIFGDSDPDVSDAAGELVFAQDSIEAEGAVLSKVGHYPHLQAHDEVLAMVLPFLARTTATADSQESNDA